MFYAPNISFEVKFQDSSECMRSDKFEITVTLNFRTTGPIQSQVRFPPTLVFFIHKYVDKS